MLQIHRRELLDDGRNSVTGSFVLEEWLGEPARFTVFTHNTENPLIRAISLTSPSHRVYSTRSDSLLSLKLLSLPANINEVIFFSLYFTPYRILMPNYHPQSSFDLNVNKLANGLISLKVGKHKSEE